MTIAQRVLVAESDERLRTRLRDSLFDAGVSADAVADGREAIERLDERVYTMMILEVALPVIDGVAVIDRVRKLGRAERPMLLVTANRGPMPVLDHDLVQMVLRKPLDVRQIADVVATCLRAIAPKRDHASTPRISDAREKDSSFNRT